MKPLLKSLLLFAFLVSSITANAQLSAVAREGFELVMAALGKTGAKEGTEALAKIGGREAVEGVCATVAREGGEAAVREIAVVAEKAGPQTLMALKNVAKPSAMLAPLKELSAELATTAVQRLAAGAEGKTLGELTEKFGGAALKTEAQYPGIGMPVIRDLGREGVELADRLSASEMQTLATISRDVAALPAAEKAMVMKALHKNASGFLKWVNGEIKKKPGQQIVFASELHTHWDEIIGRSDKQAVQQTSDKITPSLSLGRLFEWGGCVTLIVLTGWIGLRLRHAYFDRQNKARMDDSSVR